MNNRECVIAVLASHREARHWTDESVADDLLAQLDIDPAAKAKKAVPPAASGISEDEVIAHEAAAQQALDKAVAARAALVAQEIEAKPLAMKVDREPAGPVMPRPAMPPMPSRDGANRAD